MALPWRIQTMMDQMGGRGISGAFAYIGASGIGFSDTDGGKPITSRFDGGTGTITFEIGLIFKVNMRRGQTWKMVVALDGDDTYAVYLMHCYGTRTAAKLGRLAELVDSCKGVYCDMLKQIVEGMYDKKMHQFGGFPI
jgi:hypothetical protein